MTTVNAEPTHRGLDLLSMFILMSFTLALSAVGYFIVGQVPEYIEQSTAGLLVITVLFSTMFLPKGRIIKIVLAMLLLAALAIIAGGRGDPLLVFIVVMLSLFLTSNITHYLKKVFT